MLSMQYSKMIKFCSCVTTYLLIVYSPLYISALYTGKFQSNLWKFNQCHIEKGCLLHRVDDSTGGSAEGMESSNSIDEVTVTFIVALALRDTDHMKSRLLAVSDLRSPSYGQYLSLRDVHDRYGPRPGVRDRVLRYLRFIDGAVIQADQWGDMVAVTATAAAIEQLFATRLGWVSHSLDATKQRAVRAREPLTVPAELLAHIDFISLNCPVNHVRPRASAVLRKSEREEKEEDAVASRQPVLRVYPGNDEAYVYFQPTCGSDAQSPANSHSPPCNESQAIDRPARYQFVVSKHSDSKSPLDLQPIVQVINYSSIYCFDQTTSKPCRGDATHSKDCTCIAKLSSLPKYVQLRVTLHAHYSSIGNDTSARLEQFLGASLLFALTDVATPAFLSNLYGIPPGLSVQHGSNQSVAEFYGEFYSNEDLGRFLSLAGLPPASIPKGNVFGDLLNDQMHPGGEAQLDVEYIMAMAPGAETFFYSFSDLSPFDSANEGFLSYVLYVNGQSYPPLVHSLSYGDVEADVFLTANSSEYGRRVDLEFVKMGLRGLTVVFSSGDDGIGDFTIRSDPVAACRRANPSWPASSPYVTSVGATQLTDKYLPVCGEAYTTVLEEVPAASLLALQCSGVAETTCSSTLGGIITSGGGFSAVNDRATTAPWQVAAVDRYLDETNAAAYPPKSFFNAQGRGYPDISTYGSNYLVILKGDVIRESGTSASAPVFAAMVTLWNDIRLAYGKPPLGFINPFLYQLQADTPTAFMDIVTGSNGCGVGRSIESVKCCNHSFSASAGWVSTLVFSLFVVVAAGR